MKQWFWTKPWKTTDPRIYIFCSIRASFKTSKSLQNDNRSSPPFDRRQSSRRRRPPSKTATAVPPAVYRTPGVTELIFSKGP